MWGLEKKRPKWVKRNKEGRGKQHQRFDAFKFMYSLLIYIERNYCIYLKYIWKDNRKKEIPISLLSFSTKQELATNAEVELPKVTKIKI